MRKAIMIMAGGTGGHITPGLAIASELATRGWEIHWLGNINKMEGKMVPPAGYEFHHMEFTSLRGKGIGGLLQMPFNLLKACGEAKKAIKQSKVSVVMGMGGYVSFPGALVAKFLGIPVVIHEANAVAGTANKHIAKFAKRILTGFPNVFKNGEYVGNPVRKSLNQNISTNERYSSRVGPLKLLVVGGSQGAGPLNDLLPKAISLIPKETRPQVVHQAGQNNLDDLIQKYKALNVDAKCLSFIDDMGAKLGESDILICRSGAMTVAEVCVVGVAAAFVPLPHAIDDHQTANAKFLSDQDAGFLLVQKDLTAEKLKDFLLSMDRDKLKEIAIRAETIGKENFAATRCADICEQLVNNDETQN
ncbi:undecaprenyldiphospho-muramoylpentapeptide beta-N-acetylglucosaminyltransferase [Taylorella equigenitalis]|uniref:undecaprenyldiphospho-muramoylpentapeptide beta-N-acetylglucosaminyltransferase n=1 Tax=Taylorella equigenitalis TaxID=29575 RepID=UPI000426D49E|nr:undecaprenyldiphospho-muramoylpentapeptide beta-N-acetylglucosaminyltransferase [Taylorella equigenitalis]ASY41199.1 undecaprenyldiphospho-muramoylpentapeptide beta-N-acetylglucosaminyltransferase [Taylorella equigenitalis]